MIEEIAAIDGVESYNTSHWTIVNLYHQDTLMKGTDEREYVADLFMEQAALIRSILHCFLVEPCV